MVISYTFDKCLRVYDITVLSNPPILLRTLGTVFEAEFRSPIKLCMDRDDNIVVCDMLAHRVCVISLLGESLRTFSVQAPGAVAFHEAATPEKDLLAISSTVGPRDLASLVVSVYNYATEELLFRLTETDHPTLRGGPEGMRFSRNGQELYISLYAANVIVISVPKRVVLKTRNLTLTIGRKDIELTATHDLLVVCGAKEGDSHMVCFRDHAVDSMTYSTDIVFRFRGADAESQYPVAMCTRGQLLFVMACNSHFVHVYE